MYKRNRQLLKLLKKKNRSINEKFVDYFYNYFENDIDYINDREFNKLLGERIDTHIKMSSIYQELYRKNFIHNPNNKEHVRLINYHINSKFHDKCNILFESFKHEYYKDKKRCKQVSLRINDRAYSSLINSFKYGRINNKKNAY